jgi:hypothetical protein
VLDWVELLVNDYKRVGKFDLGPFPRLLRNDLEGNRFRFGALHCHQPRLKHAKAYVAYGTRWAFQVRGSD